MIPTGQSIIAATLSWMVLLSLVSSAKNQGRGSDGQNDRANPAAPETNAAILKAVGSVGLILVRNSGDPAGLPPRPRGSGVVVRKDGIVVTNLHVISTDNSSTLYAELFFSLPDNGMEAQLALRRYRLKPVLIKREYDLALLRVISGIDDQPLAPSEALPAIEFADSRAVQLLDKVIVIGFPQGGGTSVTVNEGIVEGKDIVGNWIKTSARLIHGNSGGAAVDSKGRLIGIPTKVIIDKSLIPKSGPLPGDSAAAYQAAAVGFLRPAQLVQSLLARVETAATSSVARPKIAGRTEGLPQHQPSPQTPASGTVIVRGLVRAADDHHPIAGARVGLVPLGTAEVTSANLLAWGGTNADGNFELNKPTVPGRYTMKVRALGYQDFVGDVNIDQGAVVIDLQRAGRQ